ncbi:class I SAM-dependent methyltransferase [Fischerella thermalis]|uniref:class I SAM-dependent methyltransferase n=1 Tax=Fischerella thermalis TaxID=372787 RepID=UPI0019EAD602|nr:class I SAM-dependent methyltransferase [Fischerella thermalis]MBF2060976.1 class I SAM-dependent methyltransferase [Fischerella thermalis M66_A2018_004]
MVLTKDIVYSNQGNPSIVKLLDEHDLKILDIGCGAGDTGQLIRSVYPSVHITGITSSIIESKLAKQKLDCCACLDIERDEIPAFLKQEFDVLIFSHVLEHLVEPVAAIQKLLPYLKIGGKVIIALPNISNWRVRWKLALGRFEYTEGGIMDKTHLHFYTFYTAPKYLIQPISEIELTHHSVNGSIPLGFLRHHLLHPSLRTKLDEIGCKWLPNLCGSEILMVAYRKG